MSCQAYLDNLEAKTGKTPNELITHGSEIGSKHLGTAGSHRDESDTLRLDSIAKRNSSSA